MKRYIYTILLLSTLALPLAAQTVHIPDPNLRAAVRHALNLPDDAPLTQPAMRLLTQLDAPDMQIDQLIGLEHATKLLRLRLVYNNISDLRPLAGLNLHELRLWDNAVADLSPLAAMGTLTHLDIGYNQIADISPLTNLTNLEWLEISGNEIVDITPLARLTQLRLLEAFDNKITDVTPLANLTRLEHLKIHSNLIFDHSPLDKLTLLEFVYDQECDMPPLPLQSRLQNRSFPSLASQWGFTLVNKAHLSWVEQIAKHNFYFCCIGMFDHNGLSLVKGDAWDEWIVRGNLEAEMRGRDEFLSHNPNMIFLPAVNAVWENLDVFPEDSPYWRRHADGTIFDDDLPGIGVANLDHPDVQARIVEKAIAVSKCGLYDGIAFDGWSADPNDYRQGKVAILKAIRERVRPDFLIAANTNRGMVPEFAPYINGFWMESGLPAWDLGDGEEGISNGFSQMEETLSWAEENAREPRINALYGWGVHTPDTPFDGPTNRRWMRAVTTLTLTFSDAYFFHQIEQSPYEGFFWYDFWDADLGRPVGEKSQLYDPDIPGLYIREFTNGWAVYNHSGKPQVVTLPEKVQGVASGLVNTEHALPNLDGEMYLRIKPKNPADVNGDGVVNIFDLTIVAQAIGTNDRQGDVNGDGRINVFDLVVVANAF